jgi:hypothetical protein
LRYRTCGHRGDEGEKNEESFHTDAGSSSRQQFVPAFFTSSTQVRRRTPWTGPNRVSGPVFAAASLAVVILGVIAVAACRTDRMRVALFLVARAGAEIVAITLRAWTLGHFWLLTDRFAWPRSILSRGSHALSTKFRPLNGIQISRLRVV